MYFSWSDPPVQQAINATLLIQYDLVRVYAQHIVDASIGSLIQKVCCPQTEIQEMDITWSADQVTMLLQLDLGLRTTYFLYKGAHYYQQKDEAAMGSPVVANIYMYVEMFKGLALKTIWHPAFERGMLMLHFVSLMKRMQDLFLHYLNSLRPTIQFIVKLEKDRSLPFLDTLLTRRGWEYGHWSVLYIHKLLYLQCIPLAIL